MEKHTKHHDLTPAGKYTKVEPATLINVKVVEIEKTIEVPVFKDVEVERPVYINKEFEIPIPIDKEYDRPVLIDKEYERPVIIEKEYNVEIPVIIEKEYDKFVPKEVPYDIPIVSMEQVNVLASQAVSILSEAKGMAVEIGALLASLKDAMAMVKESIPKEIKVPEIIKEEIVVKDVKIIEDTIHVIGKVIARTS